MFCIDAWHVISQRTSSSSTALSSSLLYKLEAKSLGRPASPNKSSAESGGSSSSRSAFFGGQHLYVSTMEKKQQLAEEKRRGEVEMLDLELLFFSLKQAGQCRNVEAGFGTCVFSLQHPVMPHQEQSIALRVSTAITWFFQYSTL